MSEEYQRIELITGTARRRHWSTEQKLRIIEESFEPGETVSSAARRHGVADRVSPLGTDLASGLDLSRFDLAVSNPPYIDRGEAPELSPEDIVHQSALQLWAAAQTDFDPYEVPPEEWKGAVPITEAVRTNLSLVEVDGSTVRVRGSTTRSRSAASAARSPRPTPAYGTVPAARRCRRRASPPCAG